MDTLRVTSVWIVVRSCDQREVNDYADARTWHLNDKSLQHGVEVASANAGDRNDCHVAESSPDAVDCWQYKYGVLFGLHSSAIEPPKALMQIGAGIKIMELSPPRPIKAATRTS